MTLAIVAGPALLELGDDFERWVRTVQLWEAFCRVNGLRPLVTEHAVATANAEGHWPIWERIAQAAKAQAVDVAVADVVRLFAFLSGRFAEVDEDGLILATTATGCLARNPCRAIATEIETAALSSSGPNPVVAGAGEAETESVRGRILRILDDGGESETDETIDVACAPTPDHLLVAVQPEECVDAPDLAIRIALAHLARIQERRGIL